MKVFGVLSGSRGGAFELGATALYVVGWLLGARYFVFALTAFAAAVVLLVLGAGSEENKRSARLGVALISAAFVIPALVVLAQQRIDLSERERFLSYLDEHECNYSGEAVVGMSRGGCRFEECVDPEPIEDQQFFCTATGRHITFSDFKMGTYGH